MRRQGIPRGGSYDIEWQEATATAHQMLGQLDEAAGVHEELLRIYGGHAVSHYELGKIYQEMGRRAEAEREYSKFLEMWSKADVGLPQLEDAHRRLGELSARVQ